MILWFAVAAVAGLLAFVYRVSGGRWGAPRQESAAAFFRRVAERTRPLSSIALPSGAVDGADRFGVKIARGVRGGLRWREVPTSDLPFRLFEASSDGGPLPLGLMLVTGAVVSPTIAGPAYAIQGEIGAYLGDLQDRWLTLRPIEALPAPSDALPTATRSVSEDAAARAAGSAAAAVVSGYVARIGGSGRLEAPPMSADRLLQIARGGQ